MQILSTKGKRGYILEAPLGSGFFFFYYARDSVFNSEFTDNGEVFLCDLIVGCLHCFKHGAQ